MKTANVSLQHLPETSPPETFSCNFDTNDISSRLTIVKGQCFSAKELGDFENVVRGGVSTNKIIPRNIRRTFKAKESPLENIARE